MNNRRISMSLGLMVAALSMDFSPSVREVPSDYHRSGPYIPTKFRHGKRRKKRFPDGYYSQPTDPRHIHPRSKRTVAA